MSGEARLDPDLARMLTRVHRSGRRLTGGSVEDVRLTYRSLTVRGRRQPRAHVASVEEVMLHRPEGALRGRVYRPVGTGSTPTTVFLHGGGFVAGDLDTHDSQVRSLCARAGTAVLSVEYRLAPEHPFPAAVDDTVFAVRWAADRLAQLGGARGPLAIAGDSAGGNLAAVAAQELKAEGQAQAQLLIYPSTDLAGNHPSRALFAQGYLLSAQDSAWFRDRYLPPEVHAADPRVSPLLRPELGGAAPALVVTAELDIVRDEAERYAARLRKAGVPVVCRRYAGLVHGFFDLDLRSPAAARAVDEICKDFRDLLGSV